MMLSSHTRIFVHANKNMPFERVESAQHRISSLCEGNGYEIVQDIKDANFIVHIFNPSKKTGISFSPKRDPSTGNWELCLTSSENSWKILSEHGIGVELEELGILEWDNDMFFTFFPSIIKRCRKLHKEGKNWAIHDHREEFTTLSSVPSNWVDIVIRLPPHKKAAQTLHPGLDIESRSHPKLLFSLFPNKDEWKRVGSHSYMNKDLKTWMLLEGSPHPSPEKSDRCHLIVINATTTEESDSSFFSSDYASTFVKEEDYPTVLSRTTILPKKVFLEMHQKFGIKSNRYIPVPHTLEDYSLYWIPRIEILGRCLQHPELSDMSTIHKGHVLVSSLLSPSTEWVDKFKEFSGANFIHHTGNEIMQTGSIKSVCRDQNGTICKMIEITETKITPWEASLNLCYSGVEDPNKLHKALDERLRGNAQVKTVIFRDDIEDNKDMQKTTLYEKMITAFKEEPEFDDNAWNWIICKGGKDYKALALKEHNSDQNFVIHLANINIFDYMRTDLILRYLSSNSRGFRGTYITLIPSAWALMFSEQLKTKKEKAQFKMLLEMKMVLLYNRLYKDKIEEEGDNTMNKDVDDFFNNISGIQFSSGADNNPLTESEVREYEKEVYDICSQITGNYFFPEQQQ